MADDKTKKGQAGSPKKDYDSPPPEPGTEQLVELLTTILEDVRLRLGTKPGTPLPEKAITQLQRLRDDLVEPRPWAFPTLGETAELGLSDAERTVWDAAVDEKPKDPPGRRIVQPGLGGSSSGD